MVHAHGLRISNPAQISPVDSVIVDGSATKMEVDGNYAFVSWDHWYPDQPEEYGLNVYDISRLPDISLFDNINIQYPTFEFLAQNHHLYLMDDGFSIFRILYDRCYEIATENYLSGFISGNGNMIYLGGNYDSNGLYTADIVVLDAINPESLFVKSTYNSPSGVISVEVDGNYAYGVCWSRGLGIVDISNPATPFLAGQYQVHTNSFSNNSVSFPYVFLWGTGALNIINVANPSQPTLVLEDSSLNGYDGAVQGDYAYLVRGSRLDIIDISIPSNPILFSSYSGLSYANHLCVSGNYAFVSDGSYPDNNLKIIDISNPSAPSLTAQIDSNAADIAVDGQYLYLGSYRPTLLIFSIADPAHPQYCGSYGSEHADALAVGGNFAFVSWETGIEVLDISDRQNPHYVDGYYLPDVEDVHVSGDIIYAAATYSLEILRFTPTGIEDIDNTPSSFSLSQNYPNPFNAQTTISYALPKAGQVSLTVYNVMGQKVATLADGIQQAGEHRIIWDATNTPSGIYFYRLKAGEMSMTEKCILLK